MVLRHKGARKVMGRTLLALFKRTWFLFIHTTFVTGRQRFYRSFVRGSFCRIRNKTESSARLPNYRQQHRRSMTYETSLCVCAPSPSPILCSNL
ncbi:uncharacterized protein LY79DRAFT_29915 [Colletotrichum navitas]|uniref:Uncharacterized protein n=1 Tax=Colletotrichum navitas TaxID=681940 RepID=A0AAD8QDP2_9PEZI|nr:uncharacterized protein LY79DRAFT_29915 [Colletotrichum navitas]KAK1600727.1 hypothetical protein LY79DRAFT_29915 [Colletotrichum navitas]